MTRHDDGAWLRLAESILDGSSPDWGEVESEKSPDDAPVVRGLRLLSRISEVHRFPEAGRNWGHFELRRLLGQGRNGDVYLAWDTRLEREVALKLLRRPTGEMRHERWLTEARRLAQVNHRNVVSVHAAEEHDGRAGLAMELLRGATLEARLSSQGTLSAGELGLVGTELCRALSALHTNGLCHGDLKAQNVIREEGGRLVLMDLGAGGATPLYMAPELFQTGAATPAGDVYALGVLLYHLATGSFPVIGDSLDDLRAAHAAGARRPLRNARPDLPTSLVASIERALAPEPSARFRDAAEMERALDGSSAPIARGARASGPPRLVWLGLAAAAVLVAVVAGRWLGREPHVKTVDRMEGSAPFRVRATILRGGRHPIELSAGALLSLGDSLSLSVQASESLFVYVCNQDEKGESYLLAPLPGFAPANPLPPGASHRLPGQLDGRRFYWQVTSAGGKERIVVLASRRRLVGFETEALAVARPREGKAVAYPKVPGDAIASLRGLGGLASEAVAPASGSFTDLLATAPPLPAGEETADGVWIRQIELRNPSPTGRASSR